PSGLGGRPGDRDGRPAGPEHHDPHRLARHDGPRRRRDPGVRRWRRHRHRGHVDACPGLPGLSGLCPRPGDVAMSPFVVLAWISVLGVAALFVALALFLRAIDRALEEVGGPASRFIAPANYLAKIRLGVRAIERQTDALAPYVTKVNAGLGAIRDGLKVIDANMAGLIAAVSRQATRERP